MTYQFSVFKYDAKQKKLSTQDEAIHLTPKQHQLLLLLLKNPGQLITKKQLQSKLWRGKKVANNTINQCVSKLRNTLNNTHQDQYIETVVRQGVKFIAAVTTASNNDRERNKQSYEETPSVISFVDSTTASQTTETGTQEFSEQGKTDEQVTTKSSGWWTLILVMAFMSAWTVYQSQQHQDQSNPEAQENATPQQTPKSAIGSSEKQTYDKNWLNQLRSAKQALQLHQFNDAEQSLKKSWAAAVIRQDQTQVYQAKNLLAQVYSSTGQLELANKLWQDVLLYLEKKQLWQQLAEVHLNILKLKLSLNQVKQAEQTVVTLQQMAVNQHINENNTAAHEAQLLLALYSKDTQQAQQQLNQLRQFNHPLASVYQGDLARVQNQPAQAELYYLEALVLLTADNNWDHMVLIHNRLSDLYLTHSPHKLNDNIARTLRFNPFIYPVQKYQAQALYSKGMKKQAMSLLESVKVNAADFWNESDQQLLNDLKNQFQNKTD